MYLRFLNNDDYLAVMTEQVFDQTVQDRADELCIDAEKSAEATIREYLTEHYEIDEELNVGKLIAGYSSAVNITYPPETSIYIDGVIYKTLTSVLGAKKPLNFEYWEEVLPTEIGSEIPIQYSQMETYSVGHLVTRLGKIYRCIVPNGLSVMDIRMPGVEGWKEVSAEDWIYSDYKIGDVVIYDDIYYNLSNIEEIDNQLSPDKQPYNWTVIDNYDDNVTYNIGDYAIYYGTDNEMHIVKAIQNVNRDEIVKGKNVIEHDPRNLSIRDCMLKLSAYNLTKGQISPNNISSVRIKDYEDAMTWLNRAGKLQITPSITRKRKSDGSGTSEWATSQVIKEISPYGGWSNF